MKFARFTDMPILVKMGVAPACAALMVAVAATAMMTIEARQSSELKQVVQTDLPVSLRLKSVAERITAAHGRLYMLMTHQAADIDTAKISDQMADLLTEIDKITAEVKSIEDAADPEQRPALAALRKDLGETRSALDAVAAMVGVDFKTAAGFVAPFEENYQHMAARLTDIVAKQTAASSRRADASYAMAQSAAGALGMGALVCLLLVLGSAYASVMPFRRDILKIAGATERLSEGDNSVELESLRRGDELGAMVRALAVFRDNQRAIADMREQQAAASRMTEDERRVAEAARATAQAQQATVVTQLAAGLERLASGDLTFRIEEPFAGEYEQLRTDFNKAIGQLQDALKVVIANTVAIQSGTVEISAAADDLSRRTEQTAASLEETAAAVEEISATVNRTAEGANHAKSVVTSAQAKAERSSEIVSDAVKAMSEISTSARQISQIIGVIDEIAFQTNLLALNAGVEAARAGDAGRGFAVVASEVRALAQRSADAAKEIKTLISASTAQVNVGVNLVGQTGEALTSIASNVTEITELVNEIAASAQEQATGLIQVNSTVSQMDQVTQQNAAMVEQTTAAMRSLREEASELARLFERFKIGSTSGAIPGQARAPAAPAQPRGRVPAAPQRAVAMRTTASAAARPAAPPREDNWDEF